MRDKERAGERKNGEQEVGGYGLEEIMECNLSFKI